MIFQDFGTTGLGVVVHNSEGMVIAALSECLTLPPTIGIEPGLWVKKGDYDL